MRGLTRAMVAAGALLWVTGAAHAVPLQLITNGGFETGDFTGWTHFNQSGGSGDWFVSNSNTSPLSGFSTPGPASGNFYALTDQTGPGAHVLLQTFTIPVGATDVTLTFNLFSQNQNGTAFCPGSLDYTASPNQCDRVDILTGTAGAFDTGAGVVDNLYEDAPPPTGWLSESFNLNLLPGTYQLRFGEVDDQFFNQMGVDNVSLTVQAPEPATLSLLGVALLGFGAIRRRKRA